ncbi:MAG: lipid A 3-O-deacylase [Rudaea sp.]|uniref:lipid A 3-O-deacylase n=1 Tax=unclassified Rudaea TaxID=2627037 RepID=UPI0010F889F7|nr:MULTISPECIES: lipid A 3-O-deacylase [unclassified Rudaea]MBN8886940.1 lipid A 3-O-deacylase [Rudaea sp.]MBR0346923.1 lipid A 3-O-deacylase [Rudaea sp.]
MHVLLHRLRALAAASLAFLALPAAAAEWNLEAGRSFMSSRDGTNTVFVEAVFDEHRFGDSRFTWAPDVSLGWIEGRGDERRRESRRYRTDDDVLLLAGGARFRYGGADDWYRNLFFSFQVAAQDGRTRALSDGFEFVSTFGYTWHHLSLQLRHISDGGARKPNWGETAVLVGVGFDL